VASATNLTANITIAANAATGTRTVTVTTGSEVALLRNGFTVNVAPPVITQVNPNSGAQGQAHLAVAISGQFTTFSQATSQVSFGAPTRRTSEPVASATSLTANITIAANAATGARTVTVTTGSEVATLANGFTVNAGTAVITQVN